MDGGGSSAYIHITREHVPASEVVGFYQI